MTETVIYHKSDFDGIFCREIARKFLPHADLIGWEYGDPTPKVPDHSPLYILDLSVPDLMQHPQLIWIDHHKSAIDKYRGAVPGYCIDGVAACRLTYQWFSIRQHNAQNATNEALQVPLPQKQDFIDRTVPEPYAVRLAGEYDIWDKRDPNADVFQFGLRSLDLEPHWPALLSPNPRPSIAEIEKLMDIGFPPDLLPDGTVWPAIIHTLISNGQLLHRYQQEIDASVINHRSFIVQFEGLNFLGVTSARCNSLSFSAKDIPETGHDALMGFFWTGKEWSVSLYHAQHRKDLDLSAIAVKYGGGGHRGACGFRTEQLPFLP